MMSEFHFIRPLWLLALIPLAVALWRLRGHGGGLAAWRGVCDPHLLEALTVGRDQGGNGRGARWLLGLGWLLAVVALAGPSWERLPQPLYKEGGARVILLDLSRSMDAADVAPSRLERARFKLLDILEQTHEGQTALIAFAAEPYVVAPLTDDAATIANLARPLATALMPAQGSRPERALERGEALLKQAGVAGGELLLIGDGVNDEAIALAGELRAKGRSVSVLAVGSHEGAPIPMEGGGFLKDESGAIVIPKLEEAPLRRLAREGGGRYHLLTADDRDLRTLLADAPEGEARKEGDAGEAATADAWREEGPWLVLLLLPLALFAFRRGWLGALLLATLLPPPADAFEWADFWQRPDQRAAARFDQAPAEAAQRFQDPAWRAAAHHRAGQYEDAAKAWQGIDTPDAHYNRGNALARQGKLQEALKAYDQALKTVPEMVDAQANRRLIEELLKQQQPPQGQQGENGQENQQGESEQQPQPGQSGQSGEQGEANPEQNQTDEATTDQSGQGGEPQREEGEAQPGEEEREGRPGEEESAELRQPDSATAEESSDQEPNQSASEARSDAPDDELTSEEKMRVEQWLRRVPDDPGGLLRRKFLLEHRRRGEETENEKRW